MSLASFNDQEESENHARHGDYWSLIFRKIEHPVCVACLIDKLEKQTSTNAQRSFHLQVLCELMIEEKTEMQMLLQDHPLVSQHIIDITFGENHFIFLNIVNLFWCSHTSKILNTI